MSSRRRTARPSFAGVRASVVCSAVIAASALFMLLRPGCTLAQSGPKPAQPSTPLQQAEAALLQGKFDEVTRILSGVDPQDPPAAAVRARALVARGRYAEAEQALTPVALRAPGSAAALELGLLQQMLGRPDAKQTLERVVSANVGRTSADLARTARALRALGNLPNADWQLFQDANDAYRSASAGAPRDPAIHTAWGELFLEKYDRKEAATSFRAALDANASWTPAMLGLARTIQDDNPPQASALAHRVLELNPSSVEARVFLASQSLDAGRRPEAKAELQKALDVNPSSLDAHALLAAIAYVEDRESDFEAEVARTLAIAPSYGEVYRVAGEMASHNYRFEDAVALIRRALALNANDPATLGDLGVNLLRTGDEAEARTALETSFKLDPYSKVTKNLLEVLDKVDTFTTIRDGDLVVRMPKDEAPVMRDYAIPLAHEALAAFSKRYEFQPKGPILIEFFPKHDDFAVRTLGLPGMIGALGACFGRVVTLDSPKARPPGDFLWEATLWHELAHVITLQISNQRVPRWLTEGISEFEEKRARPDWARPMDLQYAQLLNEGKTLKLRDLNAAFQDPARISLAYFEASLLVDHLVRTYGDAGLRRLLRAYGMGLDTDAALKSALDTDFDALQAGFDTSIDGWFGDLRRAMAGPAPASLGPMPLDAIQSLAGQQQGSYPVQMALGRAMQQAGQLDAAVKAYEQAARLVPMARGDDSPHAEIAAIALERKDRSRAIAELTALVGVDAENVGAARKLLGLMRDAGADPSALAPVYRRIVAVDPFDGEAHTALGRLALQRSDAPAAAREFRAALALGPVDQASALTDLAEADLRAGRRAEAKKETLSALEIAPTYQRAQDLLLQLTGDRP